MRAYARHGGWRIGGLTLVAALILSACAGSPSPAGDGKVVMLSSQFEPIEEAEKMRTEVLADFEGEEEFIGVMTGPLNDRIQAESQAESGEVSLIGGLHGEFSVFAADDLLMDLSDVLDDLGDVGVNEQYLELGKLGTDEQLYIPWMQATYIMAARQEAMQYLPEGADVNALTWEQVTEWGANIEEGTGERKLGFPAGPDGLWHRFFQGFGYPAFTGGVNTTFASDEALDLWSWLDETWAYVNPQSTTYSQMQEPLQSGEVWVAWDHTARLIDALNNQPDDIVAFPVAAGPEGRAFMPVIAGLAIPKSAPNPDGAKELIKHLLQPETQATTLRSLSFFPVISGDLPGDLEVGTQAQQEAVSAMTNASDALPALLPIGLAEQGDAYNDIWKTTFQSIILNDEDPASVLEREMGNLQAIFDQVEAPCWQPDPVDDGVCQVQ